MLWPKRGSETAHSPTVASPALGQNVDPSVTSDDVARLLQKCCDDHVAAIIVLPDLCNVCQARFAAVSGEIIQFDLLSDCGEAGFMPLTACCVSFFHGDRARIFLSVVREYPPQSRSAPQLFVELPSHIVSAQMRRTFRVPVGAESGLKVQVVADNHRSMTAQALDISMCGVLLEFPADDLDLPLGTRLEVELQLDSEVVKLAGEVRRCEKPRYSIFFPEAMRGKDVDPPESVRRIVTALERKWLQRKSLA